MDGEKLKKYLNIKQLSQDEMLTKYRYSKGKLYATFKLSRINDKDRLELIKDFELPDNFFDVNQQSGGLNTLNEPDNSYQIEMYRDVIKQKDEIIQQQAELIRHQGAVIEKLKKVK